MKTSQDAFVHGGGTSPLPGIDPIPPCAGLTSNALPKVQTPIESENSDTGVSTRNAPNGTSHHKPLTINHKPLTLNHSSGELVESKPSKDEHWYALRCTYGREKKAYEYLLTQGIQSFYPTITTKQRIDGKNTLIEQSRLPNIFFAYATFDLLKPYVYDNIHDETKYLRFYYNHHHDGTKEPLIVPESQMRSLMLICQSQVDDILLEPFVVEKFLKGEHVLVKEGPFAGVEGVVARFMGQQRVGITIAGMLTMVTAYIPTAFLEHLDTK